MTTEKHKRPPRKSPRRRFVTELPWKPRNARKARPMAISGSSIAIAAPAVVDSKGRNEIAAPLETLATTPPTPRFRRTKPSILDRTTQSLGNYE